MLPATAGCFRVRDDAVRLREALVAENAPGLDGRPVAREQVLTGMGGVGKTQLAAEYARTAWHDGEVDLLVWITASSSSAIMTGYAQAAVEVMACDRPVDLTPAAQAFLAWLEPKRGQRPCRWLIVLDDVADPQDLSGLWPPASPHGRTVVTTRRQDAALARYGHHPIEVGLFTQSESLAYLTSALATCDRHEPREQLAALGRDLGHLPLALSQAAAYLIDTGTDVGAYRHLLADRSTALREVWPDALPDGQTLTVAATWALSIAAADRLRPPGLARSLLQIAAFLDANGIPDAVLSSAPTRAYLARPTADGTVPQRTHAQPLNPQHASARDTHLALNALRRLSLIQHSPETPSTAVRVHQLIQRAVRDTLSTDYYTLSARFAADALMAAWPDIDIDAGLAQALRANAAAVISCAQDALLHPRAHAVVYRLGTSLGDTGHVTAARAHFDRLVTLTTSYLGPDHPDTLTARHSLAHWRGVAGQAAAAATAFADLLADRTRVLGKDHPCTLSTRHSLARWQGEVGDAIGAATAFAELLAEQVQILGRDHPDTLSTRLNLAFWQGTAGAPASAVAILTGLVGDMAEALGEDHPDTHAARHSLAYWKGAAGDAPGAVDALGELLADRIRVLGKDHPRTLTTRHVLARWRGAAGDAPGAVDALGQLLADRTRILGKDHPDTLTARHSLAHWQGEAGDAAGAAAAFADLVSDRIRVQGDGHPKTLAARHSLAHWQGEAGDAAGAAAAFADLVSDCIQVLGPDHPDTATTRDELARWSRKASVSGTSAGD
ncbi:tetratricopeptide repeat protein [Streptomyces sp. NPDC102394]|uniref:tetratricopeptide repeat protein n=1 Tax=Streptomyces sp. NPDC102394 TaxID=3366167 RepID=UPI003828C26E